MWRRQDESASANAHFATALHVALPSTEIAIFVEEVAGTPFVLRHRVALAAGRASG